MKSTGIVRKLDDLGRIVIPMELRRSLGIHPRDSLEISVSGERIILAKHHEACSLCGSVAGVEPFKKGRICAACRQELRGRD